MNKDIVKYGLEEETKERLTVVLQNILFSMATYDSITATDYINIKIGGGFDDGVIKIRKINIDIQKLFIISGTLNSYSLKPFCEEFIGISDLHPLLDKLFTIICNEANFYALQEECMPEIVFEYTF